MNRTYTTHHITPFTAALLLSILLLPNTVLGLSPEHLPSEQPITPASDQISLSLQEQINRAAPGDTIILAPTTYNECLRITKPIHLQGQGTTQTFLSPTSSMNGYAISISVPQVKISNIDITNQAPGIYTTAIQINTPNTTIQDCTFHDTPIGIAIWSSYNTIANCTFTNCNDEGIVLLGTTTNPSHDNTITHCLFSKNCDGVELQYATTNHITFCSFTANTHAGIDAIESNNNHNIISNCTFTDNQGFGLYMTRSSENLITDCSFSEDSITFVQARNNTLSRSKGAAIHLMKGSHLQIHQCTDITESAIISQQSSYEMKTDQPTIIQKHFNQLAYYLSFIQNLLFHYKISKLFIEKLHQHRM
ncbi:MAG: right-handed parallel beta-helix repeat-containing protein [Candidatus Thermoplasmatota archaeon]|nr:right-handed parallel beta-helix repeat-containing protein [Candidatus Thermoplasmatota archaeon]